MRDRYVFRRELEVLEDRRVPSGIHGASHVRPPASSGPSTHSVSPTSFGGFTFADEEAFATAYLSFPGQPNYNPAVDLNHNGFVGQDDGKTIVTNLANPPSTKIPLKLELHLAPDEQVPPPLSPNSGGETRLKNVTIIGRTTPFSLVFTDNAAANYKFKGPVFVSNQDGVFAQNVRLNGSLTNFDFRVIAPNGHQVVRSFPILLKSNAN
jgi:hypothetical protein